MWSSRCAGVGAVVGWAVAVLDAAVMVDLTPEVSRLALAAGISLTMWVMLCLRRRPLGQAYDLGYEHGRRDGIRAGNGPGGGRVVRLRRNSA